jgi:hypothetical protein
VHSKWQGQGKWKKPWSAWLEEKTLPPPQFLISSPAFLCKTTNTTKHLPRRLRMSHQSGEPGSTGPS